MDKSLRYQIIGQEGDHKTESDTGGDRETEGKVNQGGAGGEKEGRRWRATQKGN